MSSGVNGLVSNGPPFHRLAGTCVVALLSLLKPSFQGVALLSPRPPVHLLGVGAVQSPALPRVWGEAEEVERGVCWKHRTERALCETCTTCRQAGCFTQQRMLRVSVGFECHVA